MKTADDCHYANAKTPEISIGFCLSEYSGSPLEVVQLFRSTKTAVTVPFLTNQFIISVVLLTYVENLEKECELAKSDHYWLVSPRVVHPACHKYHSRALFPFLDIWRDYFGARKKRLAARGSRLEVRVSKLAK